MVTLTQTNGETLEFKFWSFFGAWFICYLTMVGLAFAIGFSIGWFLV